MCNNHIPSGVGTAPMEEVEMEEEEEEEEKNPDVHLKRKREGKPHRKRVVKKFSIPNSWLFLILLTILMETKNYGILKIMTKIQFHHKILNLTNIN